jgi:hypothetical protein
MKNNDKSSQHLKVFGMSKMNKNPLLYKYYWWVVANIDLPADLQAVKFTSFPVGPSNIPMTSCVAVESKQQDRALRLHITKNFHPVCLFDALKRMTELESTNQRYVALLTEFPRLGSPFNPKHEKWKDREFASAFDEDNDPDVDGFK